MKPETRNSEPRTFKWPVRVYYEDTDSSGVVYYANYLRFLERARTEWLRAAGFEQTELAQAHEVVFVVTALTIEYRRPARFNDSLSVSVEPAELGASRIVLLQRVLRGASEIAVASVRLACVNTATFKPARIPGPVAEKMGKTK
ncbi:MAG: tol-pal system-associated acyl-CoA thioesterase [Burkholderiales bacterium]